MKGIECALVGRLNHDAELRQSKAGRDWLWLSVEVEGTDGSEYLTVGSWSHSIADLAPMLKAGGEVYIEGKLKLRRWDAADGTRSAMLNVQASVVQPLGLIGEKKPKRTRAPKAAKQERPVPITNALPFNDDISYLGT
jgi:single-stranded DNA-binding protein